MKTYQAKSGEIERKWYLVDAADKTLGRLSTRLAVLLRGKDKATFTPSLDTGAFIVVVNAAKIRLTGKKPTDKMYYRHSGQVGGLTAVAAKDLLRKDPARVLKVSVWGMLPKSALSRKLLGKLKVYADDKHPHGAQCPQAITV